MMAISNEWEEWHLTPKGWVAGTENTDFNRTQVSPPNNRVATYIYCELVRAFRKIEFTWQKTWGNDNVVVSTLLELFGTYPNDYIKKNVSK
jgi:hypothetical protein